MRGMILKFKEIIGLTPVLRPPGLSISEAKLFGRPISSLNLEWRRFEKILLLMERA